MNANTAALVAWNMLTEPGDTDAITLIDALGAEEALARVKEGTADQHGASPHAIKRWAPRIGATTPTSIEIMLSRAWEVDARLVDPHEVPGIPDLGTSRPIVLWVRGDLDALTRHRPSITVMGARACTGYGEHVAQSFVNDMATAGLTIHAGAAYGIDAAAHRAALAAGGSTIAWMASGADSLYPHGHAGLINKIIDTPGSAVVTEVPPGHTASRWRFLARNRLAAAATAATLIVEAGWRSGALSVAGNAKALDRPVGAVPGPITSPASQGCHRLIREYGAQVITTAEEAIALTATRA